MEADSSEAAINQFLTNEISEIPREILTDYVNNATVSYIDKQTKCNKLLRKAVRAGEIALVELILTNAATQGRLHTI